MPHVTLMEVERLAAETRTCPQRAETTTCRHTHFLTHSLCVSTCRLTHCVSAHVATLTVSHIMLSLYTSSCLDMRLKVHIRHMVHMRLKVHMRHKVLMRHMRHETQGSHTHETQGTHETTLTLSHIMLSLYTSS